ncbi:hypothetical protein V1291_000823 [Nitrobacteraceae bacterium AZCC 1564]
MPLRRPWRTSKARCARAGTHQGGQFACKAPLVNLMAAVALRNPWRRKEIGKIVDFAAHRLLADKFATKEKWQQAVAEMKADGVWDEKAGVKFEDMQQAVKT